MAEVLIKARIGNKELVAASREIVKVGREKVYKLKEIELSGRDLDLLSSKIEPLVPLDKLKLKYFQERENSFGALTPMLKDSKICYILAEGAGLPVSVAFDGEGILRTNLAFGRETLAKQILKVAARIGIIDDMFHYNKKHDNLIVTAISGGLLGIRVLRQEIVHKKLVYPKISREALAYLLLLISRKANIIIVGPKGSGKTDLAAILARHAGHSIITIEDYPKIVLDNQKWMPLIKPKNYSTAKLIIEASRMKPDYILLDELSGKEAAVLLNKRLGSSCITTLTLENFEYLVDVFTGKKFNLPKAVLSNADVLVNVGFGKIRGKRTALVKEIIEIGGYDLYENRLLINTVFRWDGKQLRAFNSSIPMPSREKLTMLLRIAHSAIA